MFHPSSRVDPPTSKKKPAKHHPLAFGTIIYFSTSDPHSIPRNPILYHYYIHDKTTTTTIPDVLVWLPPSLAPRLFLPNNNGMGLTHVVVGRRDHSGGSIIVIVVIVWVFREVVVGGSRRTATTFFGPSVSYNGPSVWTGHGQWFRFLS